MRENLGGCSIRYATVWKVGVCCLHRLLLMELATWLSADALLWRSRRCGCLLIPHTGEIVDMGVCQGFFLRDMGVCQKSAVHDVVAAGGEAQLVGAELSAHDGDAL